MERPMIVQKGDILWIKEYEELYTRVNVQYTYAYALFAVFLVAIVVSS